MSGNAVPAFGSLEWYADRARDIAEGVKRKAAYRVPMHRIIRPLLGTRLLWARFPDLHLSECDVCGAVVSDPDLHNDWHKTAGGR